MSFQALAFQPAFQQQIFGAARQIIGVNEVFIILKDPDETLLLTFDWTDALITGTTLSSCTCAVVSPLTKANDSTDTGAAQFDVDISGGLHAKRYVIALLATLSNGQTVARNWPVQVYN